MSSLEAAILQRDADELTCGRPPLTAAELVKHPEFEHVTWALKPAKKGKIAVAEVRGGPIRMYVFSESIFPLLTLILGLETCLKSLYFRNMFQCFTYTPQIGNTDCEFVIQIL